MAEEKIEVEVVEEEKQENAEQEEKQEEPKKENKFKAFFKGVKKNIDDSVLEGKIVNTYNKPKDDLTVYAYGSSFGKSYAGNIEDLTTTIIGEEEIKEFSVLVHDKTETAYYVTKTEATTVKVTVDEVEYERPGTKIYLTADVTEVKVIKAGKKYYLYKGNEK